MELPFREAKRLENGQRRVQEQVLRSRRDSIGSCNFSNMLHTNNSAAISLERIKPDRFVLRCSDIWTSTISLARNHYEQAIVEMEVTNRKT